MICLPWMMFSHLFRFFLITLCHCQSIAPGRLFGGYATRGQGITHATYRFAEVVEATHLIAKTRPKDLAQDPYLSAQVNSAKSLPLHKNKNNHSRTWLIAFGDYTGGEWLHTS